MKVKLTTSLGGTEGTFAPGDTPDLDDAEAIRLIEAGHAVPIDARPPREQAVKPKPPETR